MKRIVTLILCLSLAAGMLAGCGGGKAEPSPTPAGEKKSVVIAMGTTSEPEAGFDPPMAGVRASTSTSRSSSPR